MSDAPERIYLPMYAYHGMSERRTSADVAYCRADLVDAEITRLTEERDRLLDQVAGYAAEVERLRAERDGYREDAERVREQRDRMVAAERQRARMPEELVERIRTAVEYDLQEQFGGDLVKRLIEDVLAWQAQQQQEDGK